MQIKDYIKGNRRGKEANRLEREAMNDPFLQGALDGFDSVAGDHDKIIEQLEQEYTRPATIHKPKNKTLLYWAAAASILLLIGIGSYLLLTNARQDIPMLAEVQPAENENVIPDDSFVLKSEHIKASQAEPLIAERTNKKTASAPQKRAIPPVVTESIDNSSVTDVDILLSDVMDTYSLSEISEETPLVAELMFKEQEKQTIQGKVMDEAGELHEVVVVGYDTQRQRQSAKTGAVSQSEKKIAFGEKEFRIWCQQKANKNVCSGNGATVEVSFFIDETGEPAKIEFQKYSCEDAKKEMENLLSSSPLWTKTNRKVTVTIKW